MSDHKGWHERGYLPHFDAAAAIQHVVFRLDGSLPASVVDRIRQAPEDFNLAVDEALDSGEGPNWLGDPFSADIVAEALTSFDGERYRLLAWAVMPNHVHVLIKQEDGWPLSTVVKSWKSFTARKINHHLGRTGAFWAPDYFDRFMRDDGQIAAAIDYIEANPVKAGLCHSQADWRWSSATARPSELTKTSTSADLEVRAPSIPFER
jgi:REP element-mobilizing transposase RayT